MSGELFMLTKFSICRRKNVVDLHKAMFIGKCPQTTNKFKLNCARLLETTFKVCLASSDSHNIHHAKFFEMDFNGTTQIDYYTASVAIGRY